MRSILVSAILLIGTTAAFASGGLGCEADANGVKLDIQSGVTRGMGGPLFQFKASFETASADVPQDLRKMSFEREHVPQYWFDGEALKLLIYRERGPEEQHGYVEVLMETAPQGEPDEGIYTGTFKVTVFDASDASAEGKTVHFEGPISCFVE